MSAAHDHSRRSLARLAGLILMVWGIGWAGVCALGAICIFAFAIWTAVRTGNGGYYALAAGAVIGGLVLVAIGAGKAMAGWILVKEDRKL
jgi:hypothetical protein